MNQPTSIFYDIDARHRKYDNGTEWYPITRAGKGRAWEILYERVPHGVSSDIVIDDLGARMKLIQNRWYVDVQHVDVTQAFPVESKFGLTCMQVVAVGVLVGGAIGIALWELPPTLYVWVMVATVVIMFIDSLIQRMGGR